MSILIKLLGIFCVLSVVPLLLCNSLYTNNSSGSLSDNNETFTYALDVNDGFIWLENNGKIAISSHFSYHKHYLLLDTIVDLFYFDNINYKMYTLNTNSHKALEITEYNVKTHNIIDIYYAQQNISNYSSILMHCTPNNCSLFVDTITDIMYFATKYGYFYLNTVSMEFNMFSHCKQCYDDCGKITVHNNNLYHLMEGVGILMIKEGLNQEPNTILENKGITSFVIDKYRNIMYFNVFDRIYYTNLHSYHYHPILELSNTEIHSLNINADGSMLFIEHNINENVYIIEIPTPFGSITRKYISKSQYLLGDTQSINNALFYYEPHLDIVAVSSRLSYGVDFLSDLEYIWNISYDAMYLDNENHMVYLLNVTHKKATIMRYNLKNKMMDDIYYWRKDEDDNTFLWHCNLNRCSIYVDGNKNRLYLAHSDGYLCLCLRNNIMVNKGSWNEEYLYRFGKIMVYHNYLYFIGHDIGVLRKKLNGSTEVFVDDEDRITSFVIDEHRHIMYYTTKNKIYSIAMDTMATSNINIQISNMESLQINMNGTMLLIEYRMKGKLYAINWPTMFGCNSCIPLAKPLGKHKVLFYDTQKQLTQLRNSQAVLTGSGRKLLVAGFTEWNTSVVTLPRGDQRMAVGHYDGSIFLFGGASNSAQMIEYIIANNTMIDHTTTVLSAAVFGSGQFYTQIDSTLFMIDTGGNKLSVFNFTTLRFEYYWNQIEIPIDVVSSGCLTSHGHHLFVIGGGTGYIYLSDLQVLDLVSNEWINAPSMQYQRRGFTCNVHSRTQQLYAIAGAKSYGDTVYIDNTEKLSVSGNFSNGNWILLADAVLPVRYPRSVVFENEILVIGGDQNYAYQIRIQSINCITGRINTEAAFLKYEVTRTAAVIVNNVLYAFGGKNTVKYLDTFQYSQLFTYEPTQSPTHAPTFLSSAPTKFPTNLPSKSPTNAPSLPPTRLPSLTPTLPTASPTFSPICVTYNSSSDLDKSTSVFVKDYQDYYKISTSNIYTKYEGYNEFEFYSKIMSCFSDIKSECYVRCFAEQTCTLAILEPINPLSLLSIICDNTKSCKDMNIIIDNINTDNIVLICNTSLSCNDMRIDINHDNSLPLQSLAIYCVNKFSCYGMEINIIGQTLIEHHYNEYNIFCETYDACNNLKLTERNIKVTMVMYEYSDDITIKNDIGFIEDSIVCGKPSDLNSIIYNSDDFNTDSKDVYFESQSLYPFNRFPCEGIVFECVESPSDVESCEVMYEFIAPSSLIPIDYDLETSCYEINILYLQHIFCDLICNNKTEKQNKQIHYIFDVQFEYKLIFTDNSSIEAEINLECKHFFGDEQSTKLSLQMINEIYYRLLSLYVRRDYIKSVQTDPETELLSNRNPPQNETFSTCLLQNHDAVIRLKSYFQINDSSDRKEMEQLFSKTSFFHNQTTDLLYNYFEVHNIIFFDIIINETILIPLLIIKPPKHLLWGFWTLVGVTTFIIILLFIIYRKYKNTQKAAMELRHPLVVLLGIGEFDDDNIQDLDVGIDINNLRGLFSDTLQYATVPRYNKDPKLHWTQEELTGVLQDVADILEDNIEQYDGLIVTVSGHGLNNNILTSDLQEINKNAIHRIFSTSHPKSRNIPRLILYDCCDGPEQMKGIVRKKQNSDADKNYDVEDIPRLRKRQATVSLWKKNEQNPDHKLATIHAANLGFQSKMNKDVGSYMIYNFTQKMLKSLENNNNMFLYEIFDEIQDELGDKKQLAVCTYNNGTRFIKCFKNTDGYKQNIELDVIEQDKFYNVNNAVVEYESKEVELVSTNDNILLHTLHQMETRLETRLETRFERLETKLDRIANQK